MDVVAYIVCSVVSGGPSCDDRLGLARQRLSSALESDAKRARRLLWHAGQMVAVATEYLVSAPCEVMRLFMAYVFILALARHGPRHGAEGRGGGIRLDTPSHVAGQREAVAAWVQHGGPARIGSAADVLSRDSTGAITRDAQAVFQRLRSWGLAGRFAKILQCFERSEGQSEGATSTAC